MRSLFVAGVCGILVVLLPSPAGARPCGDRTPAVVGGIPHVVYTGDSWRERRDVSCKKARTIAKVAMRGKKVSGWKCRDRTTSRGHAGRCVRGGTYTDDYGNTQWRYLIGWYPYD